MQKTQLGSPTMNMILQYQQYIQDSDIHALEMKMANNATIEQLLSALLSMHTAITEAIKTPTYQLQAMAKPATGAIMEHERMGQEMEQQHMQMQGMEQQRRMQELELQQ